MLKLRNDDPALTSRPVKSIESGSNAMPREMMMMIICRHSDANSINSDNAIPSSSSPPTVPVQSNRQRNSSVSSSCPSVTQELSGKPKGYA